MPRSTRTFRIATLVIVVLGLAVSLARAQTPAVDPAAVKALGSKGLIAPWLTGVARC